MIEENKDKIELTPAEESPWGEFLLKTIELDEKYNLTPGFHWFWGFYYLETDLKKLLNFNFQKIKKELDNDVWLNKINDKDLKTIINSAREPLSLLLQKLLAELGNPEKIKLIDFSKMRFGKEIDFSYFIFPIKVSFIQSEFFNHADFALTSFHGITYFQETKFHDLAFFSNASFVGLVGFDYAKFYQDAQFGDVGFSVVNFHNVVFFKAANFSDATFSKIASFINAIFFDRAIFNNAIFKGGAVFSNVKFKFNVPSFYDAKILEHVIWEREVKLWPQQIKNTDKESNRTLTQSQNAYENLANHMKKLDKYHDQHFFFRQEMRCRRRLGSIFNYLIYGLYEWLADYGYGVGRASMAWTLHIFLGAIIIFIIASCAGLGTQQALFCSTSTSFANANPFIFIGFKEGGLTDCYKVLHYLLPLEFGTIRGVQTLFGIPLLFIILATIRIRFRLK